MTDRELPPIARASAHHALRGPLACSIGIHGLLVAGIAGALWYQQPGDETHQLARSPAPADTQATQAEAVQRDVAATPDQRLAERLELEMEALLAQRLDGEALASAMREIEDSIDRFLADREADGGEPPGPEALDAWRATALDEVAAKLTRSQEELLVAQVRRHVRERVAPDLAQRMEQALRDDVGAEVRERVEQGLRERRRERVGELADELDAAARDLERARRQAERSQRDLRQGREERAVRHAHDAHERTTAAEARVAEAAAALAAQAPELAAELAAVGPPDHTAGSTPRPRDQVATSDPASDHHRGETVSEPSAPRAAASDTGPTQREQATTRGTGSTPNARGESGSATSATEALVASAEATLAGEADQADTGRTAEATARRLREREAAVAGLAEAARRHARGEVADALDRGLAEAAIAESRAATAERVDQAMAQEAIPRAAERVTEQVAAELDDLGIDRERFGDAVEREIAAALTEQLAGETIVAEQAFAQLRESLDRAPATDPTAAAEAAQTAAADLAASAEAVSEYVAGTDTHDAEALAEASADAVAEAHAAVHAARRAGGDRRALDRAIEALRHQDASRQLREAERLTDDRRAEQLAQTSGDLSAAAEAMQDLGDRLADPALAAESTTAIADPAAALGAEAAAAASAELAARARQAVARGVDRAAREAAQAATIGPVLAGADETLTALQHAGRQLAADAEQLADGRGISAALQMAGLATGSGRGPLRQGVGQGRGGLDRETYRRFVDDLRERTQLATDEDPRKPAAQDLRSTARGGGEPAPQAVVLPPRSEPGPAADRDESDAAPQRVPEPDFATPVHGGAARREDPIIVDGDLSDWGELTHPLRMRFRHDDREPALENGTAVFMHWAPEGIYLAYRMTDDGGIQNDSPRPYEGDCLEFWIDPANSRAEHMHEVATAHQFVFRPFGMRGDERKTFFEIGRGHRGLERYQSYPDRERERGWSAGRRIDDGYVVEAFVKHTTLAEPVLIPGSWVAVNLSLGVDGEYAHQTQWAAPKCIESWDRPELWGDVLLLGDDAELRFVDAEDPDTAAAYALPGRPIGLEITDHDMNIRSDLRDRLLASVGTAAGDASLSLILEETAPDSGVFRASFDTASRFAEPAANTLPLRPGARLEARYTDAIDATGERSRERTAECAVARPVVRVGGD